MARYKEVYKERIAPEMMKSRGYGNRMEVPRLRKIVVNIGVDASVDGDSLKALVQDLAGITGQRPVVTKARKSISNFKLREGMSIGAKVTLRGDRMYEFLERLIDTSLPRIRDFRGVSAKSFDGRGNYTLGLREQTIFPEVNPDHVKKVHGMDICMVTSAETDDEARELLRGFGMPFAGEKKAE
jgi:large subunit ribosomal protein L5